MPLSPARRLLPVLGFLLLATTLQASGGRKPTEPATDSDTPPGGSWLSGLTPTARLQPPEEEEDKKPAPKKEMPDEKKEEPKKEDPKPEEKKDDPPADASDPDGPYLAKLPNLQRAADTTPHEELKPVFARFAVAFDMVYERGKESRVTPLPLLWGTDTFPKEFGVADLQADGTAGEGRSVTKARVASIEPFEKLAMDAADQLLGPTRTTQPPKLPLPVRLEAAERVLREVLFFHDAARTANRRRGKSWDKPKAALDAKLADVRVQTVRAAGADKDWAKVKALTDQYLDRYKADRTVAEALYAARLMEAETLVKSERLSDLEQARLLLVDYESRFPGGNNPAAKAVRVALGQKAKDFLARAEREAQSNKTEARRILEAVQAIDPDNQAVRGLRQDLKTAYPTLIVGTKRLPERMSPALARFDSEKQAVELMFEGLLEQYPDESAGYAFRPALAALRPSVGGGLREVELVRNADWGGDRGVFDAADVHGTWLLNRQASGTWAADANNWLAEPQFDPGEPGRIRLPFKNGVAHPDPRLLLTQKLLPAGWLRGVKNQRADDLSFARQPAGTGPYRLASDFKPRGPNDPPKDVVFVANEPYARRPGRPAQPVIQEIRFTDVTGKDAVNEFKAGRLHVLTDVPTGDLPQFQSENNLNNTVKVATSATNLRVWGLAVNHRRPHFHDPDFRRAISRAINRDLILNEVFRAGKPDVHAALSGPFPPGVWCAPRPLGAAPPPLFSKDAAEQLFGKALGAPGATAAVTLSFAADDPKAESACTRIKAMLEDAAKAGGRPFTVTLEPLPPRVLHDRVETEHRFDLAYLPLDYPDFFYPLGLGSFLDPTATLPGGRNISGWRSSQAGKSAADDRLAVALDEARRHQDPTRLRLLGETIHTAANDAVPWVPLWQLDRHVVFSTQVKVLLPHRAEPVSPAALDATTLFSGVGRWKVE